MQGKILKITGKSEKQADSTVGKYLKCKAVKEASFLQINLEILKVAIKKVEVFLIAEEWDVDIKEVEINYVEPRQYNNNLSVLTHFNIDIEECVIKI